MHSKPHMNISEFIKAKDHFIIFETMNLDSCVKNRISIFLENNGKMYTD